MKGVVVAAPASGTGKTTVALALLQAGVNRGLEVRAFKTGPDYIDSAYHERITGSPSVNLDPWMTSDRQVRNTFRRYGSGADMAVIEGVMGVFDGKQEQGKDTSTAHVARLLELPVLLVLDVKKQGRTAAATVLGFQQFDPSLDLAGVVLNRVAGEAHSREIRTTIERECSVPVVGAIPEDQSVSVPERQLGLTSVYEYGFPEEHRERLGSVAREYLKLDTLLGQLPARRRDDGKEKNEHPESIVRVGVARDPVFCFYYEENLRLLRSAGAELVPFSPLSDDDLPGDLDGLYFGGGFPEEFAGDLAENQQIMSSIRSFSGPVLAECGGLIYLCDSFRSREGTEHEMVGRIPGIIRMTEQLSGFGYREVSLNREALLGTSGTTLRGHLFHCSRWVEHPDEHWGIYSSEDKHLGYFDGQILASFFHVHFGSRQGSASSFVGACKAERLSQT